MDKQRTYSVIFSFCLYFDFFFFLATFFCYWYFSFIVEMFLLLFGHFDILIRSQNRLRRWGWTKASKQNNNNSSVSLLYINSSEWTPFHRTVIIHARFSIHILGISFFLIYCTWIALFIIAHNIFFFVFKSQRTSWTLAVDIRTKMHLSWFFFLFTIFIRP